MAASDLDYYKRNSYALRESNGTDKYVFLNDENKLLYMGPYSGKKEAGKMTDVINRYNELVNTSYLAELVGTDGQWITFQDFTKEYPIISDESKVHDDYFVAQIDQVKKFIDVCKEPWIYEKTDDYDPADLVVTLVRLWEMGVAFQLYHFFVDTKKHTFYFMDLDKVRGDTTDNERLGAYFYSIRDPKQDCKFFERIGGYYDDAANKIVQDEMSARMGFGVSLLRKYSEEWNKVNGKSGTKG